MSAPGVAGMGLRLVRSNLARRPVRSLVGLLAVAIEVALILLVVGLTNGMVGDAAARMRGIGADVVVRPAEASMFMSLGGNVLPLKLVAVLDRQSNIAAAAPVALQTNNRSIDTIGGIDTASFDAVSGGFEFLKGHGLRAPDDVIVDDLYASARHVQPGQTLTLLGHPFHVAGIFEHGKGSRLYVELPTLDQLAGSSDKAAAIYLKLRDPQRTDATVAQLKKLLPGYNVQPMQEYLSLFTSSKIPGLPIFQRAMIGVAVTIGLLVIFLSMYTTILERTREIGILKALGASRGYITRAILREASALTAVGIVAGLLLAWLTRRLMHDAFPTLPIVLTGGWMARATAIALLGSLAGALYPALKAAGQDPIAALAYE